MSSRGGGGGGGGGGGRSGGRGSFGLALQSLAEGGTRVKKGDVLAEFDRENMLLRLDDYAAMVNQSEQRLKSLRADLEVNRKAHRQLIDVAKADLDKARLDYQTREVRSAIDTELLKLAVEETEARHKQLLKEVQFVEASLQAQIRESEIAHRQVQAEFNRYKANVDKLQIHSPMDGIVAMYTTWRGGEFSQFKQGDFVGPGQAFLRVVDPSSMIVEAKINQVDIEAVRIGQKASVAIDAFPDLVLPGEVVAIGAITEQGGMSTNYVKQVPVKLRLNGSDPRLVPDLSASVDVVIDEAAEALVVPLASVVRDAPGAQAYVWVRRPSGGWQKRPVETGLGNFTEVTIVSGLEPGEEVALEPAALGGSGKL